VEELKLQEGDLHNIITKLPPESVGDFVVREQSIGALGALRVFLVYVEDKRIELKEQKKLIENEN